MTRTTDADDAGDASPAREAPVAASEDGRPSPSPPKCPRLELKAADGPDQDCNAKVWRGLSDEDAAEPPWPEATAALQPTVVPTAAVPVPAVPVRAQEAQVLREVLAVPTPAAVPVPAVPIQVQAPQVLREVLAVPASVPAVPLRGQAAQVVREALLAPAPVPVVPLRSQVVREVPVVPAAPVPAVPAQAALQREVVRQFWLSRWEPTGRDVIAAIRRDFADLSAQTPRFTFPLPKNYDGRQRARFRAEEKFFNPHHHHQEGPVGRQADRRAQQEAALAALVHHRYHHDYDDAPTPINLDGRSAQWLVTIERLYAERLMTLRNWNAEWMREDEEQIETVPFGVKEIYRLGTTNICCCIDGDYNPLRLRHCRLMLDDVASRNTESYNAIYKRLQMYIADNQGPALARILIDAAHGVPLDSNAAAFNDKYGLDLTPDEVEPAVDLFRRLFVLLLVKEPGAFQSTVYARERKKFKAGLAVSLARALLLLRDGHIRMADVFKTGADYNPFTVQGMLKKWDEKVLPACTRIDKLYAERFLLERLGFDQGLLDLKTVFGGDSDEHSNDGNDDGTVVNTHDVEDDVIVVVKSVNEEDDATVLKSVNEKDDTTVIKSNDVDGEGDNVTTVVKSIDEDDVTTTTTDTTAQPSQGEKCDSTAHGSAVGLTAVRETAISAAAMTTRRT